GLHVPLVELQPDDFRAVLDLNVVAPLVAMQAVLPHMRAGSGGAIVSVSSATSLRLFPGLGGYAATKAALNMLSQIGRLEFAAAGVAVSVVYPSLTATEFHEHLRAGHIVGGARTIPPIHQNWSGGPSSKPSGPARPTCSSPTPQSRSSLKAAMAGPPCWRASHPRPGPLRRADTHGSNQGTRGHDRRHRCKRTIGEICRYGVVRSYT
ncbi:MAG: SDR family oxidoreductase, partial [Chloroflexota bacterium]